MSDLISIGEAAQIMGVSVDTMRRWDKKGKLRSFTSSGGGHRLYSKTQIEFQSGNNQIINAAKEWVFEGSDIEENFYCPNSSIFQARLSSLQNRLLADEKLIKISSLIGAIIGEIGINSFDHNIGNWPNIPGIFFGHDIDNKIIVLADRGQGILTTLKRVRPELDSDEEALRVAFSEIVSGRAPESRGNGLKFVRGVVNTTPINVIFQSGGSVVTLLEDESDLKIRDASGHLQGCIALITY